MYETYHIFYLQLEIGFPWGGSFSPIFSHIVKDHSWKKLDNRCMKRIHILFVSSKGSYINYVIADRGRGKGGFYK